MKIQGTPDGSGRPALEVVQEDAAPAIRVRQEGTSGNAIEVTGSGGATLWSVDAQGNASSSGSQAALTPTAVKTSAYTAAAGDLVPVDTTSGAVTVTLPNSPADKTQVDVKHITQGGTNAVTVACAGSDVFNKTSGSTSLSLPLLNQAVLLQYKASGGIWYVVTDDLPLGQLDIRFASFADPLAAALGFRNWNANPVTFDGAGNNLTSQVIYMQAINLPAGTATGVVLDIELAGSGTAPTGFFVGLCSQTTMLAQSANLNSSTALTTQDLGKFPFSSTYNVPVAGLYYVCALQNGAFGTTNVKFTSSGTSLSGLSGSPPLVGNIGTGQTTLPANNAAITFTPGATHGGRFVGVY